MTLILALTLTQTPAPTLSLTVSQVLSSPLELVTALSNKASLRARAEELGLLHLLPEHFASPAAARYPCVLKLAIGAYGAGTHIVRSAAEVARSTLTLTPNP